MLCRLLRLSAVSLNSCPVSPQLLWDSLQRTRPEFLLKMRRVFSC